MFRMFRYIFVFIFSLSTHFSGTSQSWHSSQHTLTQLYNLQREHFDVFNNYLILEAKRLEELESNLAGMHKWHSYINNLDSHNHINNIKIMTNLYTNFGKLQDLIRSEQSTEVIKQFDNRNDLDESHILSAFEGMRRLQRFYMISASDMAAGRYNNRNIGDQMDVCECYVMSKYCFEKHDMNGAIEWSIETYEKWKNYGKPKCVDIKKLNFYIISSSVYIGFDFTTLLNPNELRTSDDTDKFKRFYFMTNKDKNLLNKIQMINLFGTYKLYYKYRYRIGEERFRELCQYNAPIRILTKYSKCRYQTKNSPYRLLMPFKEEDINNDHNIKMYHDVLYDDEILNLKNLASENMETSKIYSLDSKNIQVEDIRCGQTSRISRDDESKALDARIEAFTGYSTKEAETYQIVNYGLGGHYIPHHDAFGVQKSNALGDRLVTVLFYMNDVENYGSTVFPLLDIICPTEKGAALVWINLNMNDGKKLTESLHGACPILKGNKWIMTRWLLEGVQNVAYDWRNTYN